MIKLRINGRELETDAEPDTPLLWIVRDGAGLTGSKFGCGIGMCGACTVHLDGQAIRSCITPINSVGDAAITTIEGVAASDVGKRVSAAWTALRRDLHAHPELAFAEHRTADLIAGRLQAAVPHCV